MDRQIKKKKWTLKRILGMLLISALVVLLVAAVFFQDRRSKYVTDANKTTISTVKRGVFQERIPQTGIVEPETTYYLDAIEGGNIRKIYLESGAMVREGDKILDLSNLNRELSVLTQEANLNESINRVRQTRLQLTQNDLMQQQQLAEINNRLAKLKPQYDRQKMLFEKKLIAKQEFEQTEADYYYNLKVQKITYETYQNDSLSRLRQMRQLDASESRMLQSLDGVGSILDNLGIRAPIDGQLTLDQLKVGQAVLSGQRLGQVDVISYKVRVGIDELYLPRISTGLGATFNFAGSSYKLQISKIYPEIDNGRFFVDMIFPDQAPEGIKVGQSLRLRIELGKSSEQLLLPVGGFYKDTGGNWAYVLENGSNRAVKKRIKLGRKNTDNFEILEGLQPGDQVITSSYDNFGDNEVIVLRDL